MKICIECQAELENEEVFCSECGSRQPELDKTEEPADIIDNKEMSISSENTDTGNNFSVDTGVESSEQFESEKQEEHRITDEHLDKLFAEEIKTDCQHFKVEWNQGSSTFLANTMSNLQFRITPKIPDASKAEKFAIHLKFPEDDSWSKNDLRVRRLSFARNVNINYKPGNDVSGDCSVDFHFSYKIEKDLYCFEQQIQLHIHDDKAKLNGGIQGGLNINIGDIHQEGKAGDPSLNLLNGLYNKEEKSSYEKFSSLNRETSWKTLELFQAVPLENENKAVKKMVIPLAPSGKYEKVAINISGKTIYLYTGEITAGRSRDADFLLRNEPSEDENWDMPKLQAMNLSINKMHCKIGILNNKAVITDNNSTNGTFVNGEKLDLGAITELEYHTNYEISLASPLIYPKNIQLDVKVYPSTHKVLDPDDVNETVPAGIVIKQDRKENISAVIINRWVPLSAVVAEGSNLFLTYRNNHFAVTDGKKWNWLVPGLMIELSKELIIKIDKI
jgi:hypothetical protein